MKLMQLKKKLVGRKLLSIITLDPTTELTLKVRSMVGESSYETIDSLNLLVFENNVELLFTDFDCDGYRSGDWNLSILSEVLDKGNTKEIKHINSLVRDILYMEKDEKRFFLITTDEYIITMGQDGSDSYYPSNFFDIEEAKEVAIENAKKTLWGETIEKK